jgi:hypothetical protein
MYIVGKRFPDDRALLLLIKASIQSGVRLMAASGKEQVTFHRMRKQ